jgi:hypothetical protein
VWLVCIDLGPFTKYGPEFSKDPVLPRESMFYAEQLKRTKELVMLISIICDERHYESEYCAHHISARNMGRAT